MTSARKVLIAVILIFAASLWYFREPTEEPAAVPETSVAVQTPDRPLPISARELLASLTPYAGEGPRKVFKGYYNLDGLKPLRLSIDKTEVFLKSQTWEAKDLILFNYKGDPQTLVFRLPDSRFIFLKYIPELSLEAFPQTLSAYIGWSIAQKSRNPVKIVLIEDVNSDWPRAESLMPALPPDLPN